MADLDLVRRLGGASHGLTIVATTRPDGSVHATLVNAGVLDHPVNGAPVVGAVVRGSAKKLANIRRSGRASFTFRDGWEWVSVEGPAQIIGPDDPVAGVDVPELLRAVFKAAGGTHDDWDEYDRVMAAEGRVAVLVTPARVMTN
ncbi:MAG TPA: TIGR03618 family F420-dependent PPOX class oxidoreductase [Acidimicrobiia bacterium]|nr:TIGR03618 family F420-dependent PPOX class oxidoreductase [Acidimicrobiia bacterium]